LGQAGRFVTIETAGTVERPVHADLMSISPKRANSDPSHRVWATRHAQLRDRTDIVSQLVRRYPYQLKYVVDQPTDIEDVDQHVRQIGGVDASRVFLMPQGTDAVDLAAKTTWLRGAAEKRGYALSPRLHIELFGNRRGT
jgi:7-carboxy-7-deazaguanine synthase